MNLALNRQRFLRMIAVATLLLSGLILVSCGDSGGGMYQGGGDSAPSWRK